MSNGNGKVVTRHITKHAAVQGVVSETKPGGFIGMDWITPGVPDSDDDGHDDYALQHACDVASNQN